MKSQVTRELIEGLVSSKNDEFLAKTNDLVESILSSAVNDIASKTAFVRLDKCVLQAVNEIYLGAATQLSTYDYILGISNPEIELNSRSPKNFWKFAWREFRASWRLGKKKYKKQRKNKNQQDQIPALGSMQKYKLSDFRGDLTRAVANYLQPTSVVYENLQGISLVGREDFGTNVRINVYVGIYDEKNHTFKLLNEARNKYLTIDFGSRYLFLDEKAESCPNFVQMVEIFNDLFSRNYNRVPNQILIESLLCACPKILFSDDIYKTFVNVANYIRLINPKNIPSICYPEKNIFEEKLIIGKNSQADFPKIISMLDRFKY